MTEKTGNDLNFREIRVTETGIHLDDQRIPIFALGSDVIVGSSALGSQTITLTIQADRVVFEAEAKARVEMPTSNGRDPDAYPLRRDETTLTGEHPSTAELLRPVDEDQTYAWHTNQPCSIVPQGLGSAR